MSSIPIYLAHTQPCSRLHRAGSIVALVLLSVGLAVLGSAAPAVAQVIDAPAQNTMGATKTGMVPSLIVTNAQGASLQGETLTLNGVAPSTIVFADRPVRAAGHMLTSHLMGFAKDPPNATIHPFTTQSSF
jgi:hypothetical protein